LETTPTVQVVTMGILGGCFNFNCEYTVDDTVTPSVTAFAYTSQNVMTLTVDTPVPTPVVVTPAVPTIEEELLTALNEARADTAAFVTKLGVLKDAFDAENDESCSGLAGIEGAIAYLEGISVLDPYELSVGLELASKDMINWLTEWK
jgi:hypothetical protein